MNNDDYQIIIAERGWIYVRRVSREGDHIVIRDCQNVRRWGTSRGLGEIALSGPTADTVLDHYGVVRVHVLACCGQIECNQDVWGKLRAGK
jgi:hypothetical protein